MNKRNHNLIIGLALIGVGIINLLFEFDFLFIDSGIFIALLFVVFSTFLFVRFSQSNEIAVLIFAAIFAFIGLAIIMDSTHFIPDDFIGTLLFWGMSALFIYGYQRNHEKWGLLIPAGVSLTLGLIVLVDLLPYYYQDLTGGLFFLGIGLTFAFLYFIRNENNRLDWAKIPAAILIVFSGFAFTHTTDFTIFNILFPLSFIVWGSYLIYRSSQKRQLNKSQI